MSDTDTTGTELSEDTTDDTETADAENTAEDWSEALDKVRREAKNLRDRLKVSEADGNDLRRRLHDALVKGDGRLTDPTDLPYADEHLDDIAAAVTNLIERKPHLARKPNGDVGQGARGKDAPPKDFSGLFARTS